MTSPNGDLDSDLDHRSESLAPHRGPRVSWAAVLAGAAATVAAWMLLQLLGLGVGLAVLDVDDKTSWQGAAIGTGIWGLVAPLIAFVLGGLVTGFFAHTQMRRGAILHGVVMWSIATIAGLAVMAMMVSSVVSGAARAGAATAGAAAEVAGTAVAGVASQAGNAEDLAKSFGINANDALHPVNQRLRQEGKPTVTAEQLRAATADVARDAVRAGKLDRAMLAQSLADETALTEADAQQIAERVEAQFDRAKAEVDRQVADAKAAAIRTAQMAADRTGKSMLAIFSALLLGLVSASVGAMVGGARGWRHPVVVPRRG